MIMMLIGVFLSTEKSHAVSLLPVFMLTPDSSTVSDALCVCVIVCKNTISQIISS